MPKDIYQSPYRTYRLDTINRKNEQKIQIIIEETDLLITLTDSINKEEIIDFCSKEIREQRNILKFWINLYPEIKDSLDPIPAPQNAPLLISAMCEAGKYAHVGPFAAVAGTIAQVIAQRKMFGGHKTHKRTIPPCHLFFFRNYRTQSQFRAR